mgnify:CR=1 FL=1
MDEPVPDARPLGSRISQISTRWPQLGDAAMICVRYGPAIRKYIDSLVRDRHDAEEVAQEFLLRVVEKGFQLADPDRGRFRDYLKIAVRNAALTSRRRRPPSGGGGPDVSEIAAPKAPGPAEDLEWVEEWRRCILDRAWKAIEDHERRTRGNLFHTVLRLSVDNPGVDSESLAARALGADETPLRADAFRKQLSRARRCFAEHVASEVAGTLEQPTRERVEEELGEIGLLEHVRGLLPADWDPQRGR